MAATNFRDRLQQNVSGTPGTGTITLGTATSGMTAFVAGDDGLLFDILITEGTDWELAGECTYTHSGTTISRGTLISSSTTGRISFTSSAIVSVVLLAERTIPFYITTPTTGHFLRLDSNGKWVNEVITDLTTLTGGISTADYVTFDTVNAQTKAVGKLTWDQTYGTLQLGLKGGNVNLQLGQEELMYVYNGTGSALSDGQIVYIVGSNGEIVSVGLASAASEAGSSVTIGMVTEAIGNGNYGYVTVSGLVHGLNTTGLTAGASLWLSTTPGQYTMTRPSAPNHSVLIGYVQKVDATDGAILVKIQNGYELDELHNVLITTPANAQALRYNSSTGLWINSEIIDDSSTTSTTMGWSAFKLNATLGDISSALAAIIG